MKPRGGAKKPTIEVKKPGSPRKKPDTGGE